MEHLVRNLKQNLSQRRLIELEKINALKKEGDKDLLLISSGRLFELDFLIKSLNEMLQYFELTKK